MEHMTRIQNRRDNISYIITHNIPKILEEKWRHTTKSKGRQWAGWGWSGPFLLGPRAQCGRHNGLLTN